MTIFNVLGQGNICICIYIYVLDHYPEDWTGNRISRVMAKLAVNMPYRRLPSGLDRETYVLGHWHNVNSPVAAGATGKVRRGKGGSWME